MLTPSDEHNRLVEGGWYLRYLQDSSWKDVEQMKAIQAILKAEFVTKKTYRGMFIYGNIGVGKTSLLNLISRYLVRNFEGWLLYMPATVLFTKLIKGSDQELSDIQKCTFLFIDDLGKEYDTDFPLSRFSELIEYRWANMKPTFFSSNLDMETIRKKVGYEHIADRMNDSNWMIHHFYAGKTKRKRK